MDKYKKINIGFSVFMFLISISSYLLFAVSCFEECTLEFIVGFMRPIFAFCISLLVMTLFFLFLPSHYFKNWLTYIASWYIPVSMYFVSQISVYSSGIISIDRGPAAFFLMLGLTVITIVYVGVMKVRGRT